MRMKNYHIVSLIRKKRDGVNLTDDEIHYLVNQYSADKLPDYQMAAFLMAALINGLSDMETAALTNSMLHSGKIVDLSAIVGTKVDKHSTGGVGDKLSLILAPIVASCGVPVPMIAGRGLGHSGGTLDKLESIPGFNVNLDLDRYRQVLAKHNVVMMGQTDEIAPADKRMYALRDVTSTVESIPLIASSIMSKKLAEGIDGLVLDVKYGSGAFMQNEEQALELAKKLISIGDSFEKETIAYITSMDQPLGYKIGNWLEVEESLESLKDNGPDDVMEITHCLAGTMIYMGKKADTIETGIEMSKTSIKNGSAFKKFIDMTYEQGGDVEFLHHPEKYPKAQRSFTLRADKEGYISRMNAYDFGMAAVELGAGREVKEASIDPTAGIVLNKKVGDFIKNGETIAVCYTNKKGIESAVRDRLEKSVEIWFEKPRATPLIATMLICSNVEN